MGRTLLAVGLAGACGTLARYGLQGWVQAARPGTFPWGTLAVNGLGCFAFGLVWALGGERAAISPGLRVTLLAGFMGAFTTWSSYVFETAWMLGRARWLDAAANIFAQHTVGFTLFLAGLFLGRAL